MTTGVIPTPAAAPVRSNRRFGMLLAMVAVGMAAFGPFLYWSGSLLCKYYGIDVNPEAAPLDPAEATGTGRLVRVALDLEVDPSFGEELVFTVEQPVQQVDVGTYNTILYHIANEGDETLYIRPIHHVSPNKAAQHFMMIECFCYNDMALPPGEQRELKVVYGFQPEMDVRVRESKVTYSLHPITEAEMRPASDSLPGGNEAAGEVSP